MKRRECLFSDKDLQLIKNTFRNILENYYDNQTDESAHLIIISNDIITQTIATRQQSESLLLISLLEILKLKAKAHQSETGKTLGYSVQNTIIHLKNPQKGVLKNKTVIACLQHIEICPMGLMILDRLYEKEMLGKDYNWKDIINGICKHSDKNIELSIQILTKLLKDHPNCIKDVSKSGYIKYIFSRYLQIVKDKNNIYKVLKMLKIVSESDDTILINRQKYIANLIYIHNIYIPITRQITENCEDPQYFNKIISKHYSQIQIDKLYVWSFNHKFCSICDQEIISKLDKIKKEKSQSITLQEQTKIYVILSNLSKNNLKLSPTLLKEVPIHADKNILPYLKMLQTVCSLDPNNFQFVDFKTIQYIYNKFIGSDPETQKIIENLKIMKAQPHKIGQLRASQLQRFLHYNNPEECMQKVRKNPKNNSQLQYFIKILNQKQDMADEYERDSIKIIKNKAIESLRESVAKKTDIPFWNVLSQYHNLNPLYLNNLFKILQLYLSINPERVSTIKQKRILQLIQWLQDNHGIQIIDWVAISQILSYLFPQNEWTNHIQQIPHSCFWLLNSSNGKYTNDLLKQINSVEISDEKVPIILGFVSKANDSQLKQKLWKQTFIAKEIVNRVRNSGQQSYLKCVLNSSYFIYEWVKMQEKQEIEKTFIKPILQIIYSNFKNTQHELKFIENALPHPINNKLQLFLGNLVQTNGKLSGVIVKNNKEFMKQVDVKNINNIGSQNNPTKLLETLKFIEVNPDLIGNHEISQLLHKLFSKNKYWELYPHYINILMPILSILSQTKNPQVLNNISSILAKIISGINNNTDITNQQLQDLYNELIQTIDRLNNRKVGYDTQQLKNQIERIQKKDTKEILTKKIKQTHHIAINTEVSEIKDKDVCPIHYEKHLQPSQSISNQNVSISEDISESLTLKKAFQILKLIIKNQHKDTFEELVSIFMKQELNQKQRYLLGHLLVQYYSKIKKDLTVIELLKMKDKTNLNKQCCFEFLSKYEEAIYIAKRWKLLGNQFMQLGVKRVHQHSSSHKCGCIEMGSQIIQYNLLNSQSLEYYKNNGYHEIVQKTSEKITTVEEAIPYLLLVGTSSKLDDVKNYYIQKNTHNLILKFINNEGWESRNQFVSNLSSALSSLVYTQNMTSIQVASKKIEFMKLLSAYRKFHTDKFVTQSGCSLISNLCYSNKECKQILYKYGIVELLLFITSANMEKEQPSIFKSILKAIGNLSLHPQSARQFIDGCISLYCVKISEKLNAFIHRDQEKMKILKLIVDLLSNICSLKYNTHKIHQEGTTNMIITLLQTTELEEDKILMACIDTVDGLCQLEEVENYVVMDKNLPYLLIDLLKIKEDEKLITKSIRLLTNLTINKICIPYILQANLLSVLANIVLPVYKNGKIEGYVSKILFRIFSAKPENKLILKSGYLDCLVKTIEVTQTLEDSYIDIILYYCKSIPNYLVSRTFFSIIRILAFKYEDKTFLDKCLRIFRSIFTIQEKYEEDILIQNSIKMYEKLLQSAYVQTISFVLSLHCCKSQKFKNKIIQDHEHKNCQIINIIQNMIQQDETKEVGIATLFCILNRQNNLYKHDYKSVYEEDLVYKTLLKGYKCKLYRLDGSYKDATIDINEKYMLRAYKHPNGEIKNKYVIGIRQIKDWQFDYRNSPNSWKASVFTKQKKMFNEVPKVENCVTVLGSPQWGVFNTINIEFGSEQEKIKFSSCLSALIVIFRS